MTTSKRILMVAALGVLVLSSVNCTRISAGNVGIEANSVGAGQG